MRLWELPTKGTPTLSEFILGISSVISFMSLSSRGPSNTFTILQEKLKISATIHLGKVSRNVVPVFFKVFKSSEKLVGFFPGIHTVNYRSLLGRNLCDR